MRPAPAAPADPAPLPPWHADPAAVRGFAAELLASSARADDVGSHAAGRARLPGWVGQAGEAYDRVVRRLGERVEVASLALRAGARRVDVHADRLAALARRLEGLRSERQHLADRADTLRAAISAGSVAEPGAAGRLAAECAEHARLVVAFSAAVDLWAEDLAAEEADVAEALARWLEPGAARALLAGGDPADPALARAPSATSATAAWAAWWRGLTHAEQLAVVAAAPRLIGNRDGLPAWARDAANRVALSRDLATWRDLDRHGRLSPEQRQWLANARAAERALEVVQQGRDPVTGAPVPAQLYLYDPRAFDGDGAVAVAAGELDSAEHVAVLVPGFGTDAESGPFQASRVLDLHEAARLGEPEAGNASLLWIGYDAPDNTPWSGEGWDAAGVLAEGAAEAGGHRLAGAVEGLRAGRRGDPAHLTVIGYSYGSTTAAHGASDAGLAADDLVLVGSPGAGGGVDHASDLGLPEGHVWVAANSRDPVAFLGDDGWLDLGTVLGAGLGDNPAEDDFGALRIRAESTARGPEPGFDQHGGYFAHDSESLWNITRIVNGDGLHVELAGHVTDPWWGGPRDPEWQRPPTSPDTDGAP